MVTETCKAIHPLHPQAIPIMVEEDACVEVDVLYAHVQPTKRRGSNWNDLQADVLSLIFGHLPDRERHQTTPVLDLDSRDAHRVFPPRLPCKIWATVGTVSHSKVLHLTDAATAIEEIIVAATIPAFSSSFWLCQVVWHLIWDVWSCKEAKKTEVKVGKKPFISGVGDMAVVWSLVFLLRLKMLEINNWALSEIGLPSELEVLSSLCEPQDIRLISLLGGMRHSSIQPPPPSRV